jgi:hypothetical protein
VKIGSEVGVVRVNVSPLVNARPGVLELDATTDPSNAVMLQESASTALGRTRGPVEARPLTVFDATTCFNFGECHLGQKIDKRVKFMNGNTRAVHWELSRVEVCIVLFRLQSRTMDTKTSFSSSNKRAL